MFPFSQEMRSDQAARIPPASGRGGGSPAGSASRGPAAGGARAGEGRGTSGRWTLNSPFLPIPPHFPQSPDFVPSCAAPSAGPPPPHPSALGSEFPPRGCSVGRGRGPGGELRGHCSPQRQLQPAHPFPRISATSEDAPGAWSRSGRREAPPPGPFPARQSDSRFPCPPHEDATPPVTPLRYGGTSAGPGAHLGAPVPPAGTVLGAWPPHLVNS